MAEDQPPPPSQNLQLPLVLRIPRGQYGDDQRERPPRKRRLVKRIPSEDWLDKRQVARLLGVHPGTIDRYRRRDPSFRKDT